MIMKNVATGLICTLLFTCSCNDKLKSIGKTFGTDQNEIRKQLHLVPVDSAFQLNEDISIEGRHFIFVNKKESQISGPEYLRKSILLDTLQQKISDEEDYFKNPVEKKYLIINHDYITNKTSIVLQDIVDHPSNSMSVNLDNKQADSVLSSWKISINPFR
jgi:hypothetical protein